MKKPIILLILFSPLIMTGQSWKSDPFGVSIFNNSTMLPPASFIAVFTQPIHPGLAASYEFGWKEGPKYKWFQNAGISYMYHRYVYQAILLESRGGYRWKIRNFSVEGYLQAGFMHAFYLTDRAVIQPDGTYSAKKGYGKPQFLVGAGLGFGYNLGDDKRVRRIFLDYDFRMQMPFVKSYVPLLPNGSLGLGFQFNLVK